MRFALELVQVKIKLIWVFCLKTWLDILVLLEAWPSSHRGNLGFPFVVSLFDTNFNFFPSQKHGVPGSEGPGSLGLALDDFGFEIIFANHCFTTAQALPRSFITCKARCRLAAMRVLQSHSKPSRNKVRGGDGHGHGGHGVRTGGTEEFHQSNEWRRTEKQKINRWQKTFNVQQLLFGFRNDSADRPTQPATELAS